MFKLMQTYGRDWQCVVAFVLVQAGVCVRMCVCVCVRMP